MWWVLVVVLFLVVWALNAWDQRGALNEEEKKAVKAYCKKIRAERRAHNAALIKAGWRETDHGWVSSQ